MVRTALLCVLLLCSSVGICHSREPVVEFEGRYWMPDMSGKTKITAGGIGSAIDFKDDLSLRDRNFLEGRLTWYATEGNRFRVAYVDMTYKDDSVIERNVQFGGSAFPAGVAVSSRASLEYLRLGWIWQFIRLGHGAFRLGTLLEIKAFSAQTSIAAPSFGVSARERIDLPLPTIGAVLDWRPYRAVGFFAEVSGFAVGRYGSIIDGEAGLKVVPVEYLTLVGGYRGFKVDAKDGDDYFRMTVQGPFVGVTLRH